MKKSSIFTKIMLAMVLVALVFALVACNGDEDDPPAPTPTPEPTLVDRLVEIIKSVDPLLANVKSIEAGSKVGLDLGLGVDYKSEGKGETYKLGIKGNIAATDPELAINFNKGVKEWFNLTYVGDKLYLGQPLTAVNTTVASKMDTVSYDVAALNPAVDDLMYVAMEFIADTVKSIPAIDFTELAGAIESLFATLGSLDLSSLLDITGSAASGYTLSVTPEAFGILKLALANTAIIPGVLTVGAIIDAVFPDKAPMLEIKIKVSDGMLNGVELGYKFDDDNYGKLTLDLSLSLTSKVTVTAPSGYTDKALNAGVELGVPGKGATAKLEAFVNPDFSADGKYLGYASLDINDQVSEGYFDGSSAGFDIAKVYAAINGGQSNNLIDATQRATKFTATFKDDKGEVDSLVKIINRGAAKVKADYIADKGKPAGGEGGSTTDPKEPSKSLFVTIYGWLGGNVEALGTVTADDEDKTESYNDPTEQQMMQALKAKIGDYVRFEIDTGDPAGTADKPVYTNYIKTIKSLLKLVADNDQWIIGFDLVKEDLSGLTEIKDLIAFDKWIVLDENDKVVTPEDGSYGIFNWDKTNWNGGVKLTVEGENNDLLDAVNVFAKRKVSEGDDKFTTEYLSEVINYYIASLAVYMNVYTAEQLTAIATADRALLVAKNKYLRSEKTAADEVAWEAAQTTHKTTLKNYFTATVANGVIKAVLGFEGSTQNYLKEIADTGLYIRIACVKDAGLNGSIALLPNIESTLDDAYAYVSGHIGFADDNEVATKAAAVKESMGTTGVLELTDHTSITADSENADDYRIIDEFEDGTEKVYIDDDTLPSGASVGDYIYVTDKEGNFVYSDKYANGEIILKQLMEMVGAYCKYAPAASAGA